MKKPLFLTLVFSIAILSALSASADPGFNIVESHINITTGSETTLNPSFKANNTGTTRLNINFSGLTLSKGNDNIFIESLNNITNLANGSSQTQSFSIGIPKQQLNGVYIGTLTANSNASNSDTISFNINVTPTYDASVGFSEMELGSARLNSTHTRSFNITNRGNADLTNVSFAFSESGTNLRANKTNFVLQFNQTEAIEFNITVPELFSTGNITLGTLKISSPALTKDLFTINANVGGGLIIEDLDVYLTTRKSESDSDLDVPDGRKLNFGDEEAGPGSELRFNLNIENTFSDEEDIDINDATVLVTIMEIDDGEDIEEESSKFDVNADSSQEVDVIINIPYSVEEGSYDVLIEVKGEDDSNNVHTAQMEVEIEIDRETRDVAITEASISPGRIKCSGSAIIYAAITNLGRRAEDDTSFQIVNEELGIDYMQRGIKLSEVPSEDNNRFSKSQTITPGKNAKDGTYAIELKAYIIEGAAWETKNLDITIEGCGEKKEAPIIEEKENQSQTDVIESPQTGDMNDAGQGEISSGEEIPILEPETTEEKTLFQQPFFIIALAALNIAIIAGIAFFAKSFFKK